MNYIGYTRKEIEDNIETLQKEYSKRIHPKMTMKEIEESNFLLSCIAIKKKKIQFLRECGRAHGNELMSSSTENIK